MLLIDAHLDLSLNAVNWNRDLTGTVADIRRSEQGMPGQGRATNTVALPDMRRGEVAISIATVLARSNPHGSTNIDFKNQAIASAMAQGQLAYYNILESQGQLRQLRTWRDVEAHLFLPMQVARDAGPKIRAGGTLLFMGGTGGRSRGPGLSLIAAATAAMPALIANLAVEVAPIRVNLIAAGFVDTPLSAQLLGDDLEARRDQLRATLPIGRVVGPEDVAALAVHLMINTALTGATYDIDGGQQLI